MKPVWLALLAATLVGCSSEVWHNEFRQPLERKLREDMDQLPLEWTQALGVVESVIARRYVVTSVDRVHGVIEASSPVRANISTKFRTRVTARVFEVGHRLYDAEARVTNELEVSEPSNLRGGQPTFDWRAVGFDHLAEVALMAEIQAALRGEVATASPRSTHAMFPTRAPAPQPRRAGELLKPTIPEPVRPSEPVAPPSPPPKASSAAPPKANPAELFEQYLASGSLYWQRREHDKALLEYQRAAIACPDNPLAHLSLASVWTALRRYAAGAAALREAAGVAGAQHLPPADLARLRGPAEELSERLLLLKGWCRQKPDDADARLLLAYHYILAGRGDEARASLQECTKSNPADAAARFLSQQLGGRQS